MDHMGAGSALDRSAHVAADERHGVVGREIAARLPKGLPDRGRARRARPRGHVSGSRSRRRRPATCRRTPCLLSGESELPSAAPSLLECRPATPDLPEAAMRPLTGSCEGSPARGAKFIAHVREHLIVQAWIHADPEGVVHDPVGGRELAGDPIPRAWPPRAGSRIPSKHGCRTMLPAKSMRVCMRASSRRATTPSRVSPAALPSVRHREQQPEPAGLTARRGLLRAQQGGHRRERRDERGVVLAPRRVNSGSRRSWAQPIGRLHLRRLEVVAELGVDVLVVIAEGQRPELAREAVAAAVVLAAAADAVAAPVAQGRDDAPRARRRRCTPLRPRPSSCGAAGRSWRCRCGRTRRSAARRRAEPSASQLSSIEPQAVSVADAGARRRRRTGCPACARA